ncbi:MAG: hypothetical protein Q4C96_01640 [Planctomycetia bacterium]|nr:hypothetical protein [Planctomycetia bacterium]
MRFLSTFRTILFFLLCFVGISTIILFMTAILGLLLWTLGDTAAAKVIQWITLGVFILWSTGLTLLTLVTAIIQFNIITSLNLNSDSDSPPVQPAESSDAKNSKNAQ